MTYTYRISLSDSLSFWYECGLDGLDQLKRREKKNGHKKSWGRHGVRDRQSVTAAGDPLFLSLTRTHLPTVSLLAVTVSLIEKKWFVINSTDNRLTN